MMKLLKLISFFLGMFFILAGCNQSGTGIFYSIEIEQKLKESILQNLTVGSMTKIESTYYIAAGVIYSKDQTADSWTPVTSPEEYSLSFQTAALGTELYACYFKQDGSSGLFKTGGNTWTEVTDEAITGLQDVFMLNNGSSEMLFVVVKNTGGTFDLLSTSDGSSFTTELSGLLRPVSDGTVNGTTYWFTSGNTLYSGSIGSIASVDITRDTNSDFGGIYYSSAFTGLFLSTADGYVYTKEDEADWIEKEQITTDSDDPVKLTDFTDFGTGIYLGSETGYFELASMADTFTEPDNNNYNNSLDYLTISSFFLDADTNDIFALTNGNGLWINRSDDSIWDRE